MTEADIRALTSGELKSKVGQFASDYSSEELLYMLDELEQREETGFTCEFSIAQVLTQLSDKSVGEIEHRENQFSIEVVLRSIDEKLSRKLTPLVWYYGSAQEQYGPVNRAELQKLAEKNVFTASNFVWREGMDDWIQATHLKGLFNNNQDEDTPAAASGPAKYEEEPQQEEQKMYSSETAQQISSGKYSATKMKGRAPETPHAGVLAAGILQFLSFPVWGVVSFLQFADTGDAEDKFLSFLFCLFMALMSVAIGIGLILSRTWGFYMKVGAGVLTLFWIFNRYYVQNGHDAWLYFMFLEFVILTLVLLNTKEFK
jgi:hypothetical protein